MMMNMICGLRRSIRRAVLVVAALLALASTAAAGTITIGWDANPEPAVMGYVVYVGTSAGNYTTSYDVGNATTFDFTGAVPGTTYYLAVKAYASGTTVSPLSGEIKASLSAAALGTPAQIAPAGTVTSATPAFSWSAVAGATSYALWVDDASKEGKIQQVYDAASVGCAAGTGTCAVSPGVTLATGAGNWWVQASNASGQSAWSTGSAFTVPSVFPPAAPKLLGPSGTVTSATPTFSWAAVANATSYSLWVDDASAPGKVQQVVSATQAGCAAGTGTCAVTPAVALGAGKGTFWVKATTAGGDSPWSDGLAFTVPAAFLPTAPTPVAPTGTVTATTPTFSWTAVPNATSYFLWVDDASAAGKVQQVYTAAQLGCAAGTGTCAVTPTVALATGTGTWWVKATTAAGDGPWSADQTFTIATPTVPGTPTLLGPAGTTTNTPTFSWKAVPGATSYALWVDDAKTAGKIQMVYSAAQLGCTTDTGTCAVAPGVTLANGAGKFWVKATNALGDGPWSGGLAFSVKK